MHKGEDDGPPTRPNRTEIAVARRTHGPTSQRLGRYQLRYEIANGGMATVYLAQLGGMRGFGKWVAIKWVHPHLAKDRRFVSMLIDEARTMSRIDHPAVCQILDFVEETERAYIVLEYLHGESLHAVVRRARELGGLPVPLAVGIAAQAARGLHAAHEALDTEGNPLGVVHRDVSPQNIHVLYAGGVKVIDFGIALARDRLTDATATGEVRGKPAYMAPEQLTAGLIDRRTDVWALGVVLWEMLARERLFRGANDAETMHHVLDSPVPPPSKARSEVGAELDAIVLRALARDPAARFQTARELAEALERVRLDRGEHGGPSALAAWMEQAHGDGRALREELLRARFRDDRGLLAIDLHRQMPTDAFTVSALDREAPLTRRRWRPWLGAALALAALVSAGVGATFAEPRDDAPIAPALAASPPPTTTTLAMPPRAEPTPPEVTAAAAPLQTSAPTSASPEPATTAASAPHATRGRGRVNVLAVPAAQVFLHGERLGETPLVGQTLPAGRQRLELRWPGERRTVAVRVRADHLTTVSVRRDD